MTIGIEVVDFAMGPKETIDLFFDIRAKGLVSCYGLARNEVLYDFLEITRELKSRDMIIHLGLDDPSTPLNIFQDYVKKAASAAAVNYELSTQESIVLPYRNGMPYRLSRTLSQEIFEIRGKGFERLIEKLKERQARFLEEIAYSGR